jgi:hypothetical protein
MAVEARIVIEDDYSFDEDPIIELKSTKQNEADLR